MVKPEKSIRRPNTKELKNLVFDFEIDNDDAVAVLLDSYAVFRFSMFQEAKPQQIRDELLGFQAVVEKYRSLDKIEKYDLYEDIAVLIEQDEGKQMIGLVQDFCLEQRIGQNESKFYPEFGRLVILYLVDEDADV